MIICYPAGWSFSFILPIRQMTFLMNFYICTEKSCHFVKRNQQNWQNWFDIHFFIWSFKLSFITLFVDSWETQILIFMKVIYITDSSTEIDTGNRLQSIEIYADHRLWIGFQRHWIKHVVLHLLCFTDRVLLAPASITWLANQHEHFKLVPLNWIE